MMKRFGALFTAFSLSTAFAEECVPAAPGDHVSIALEVKDGAGDRVGEQVEGTEFYCGERLAFHMIVDGKWAGTEPVPGLNEQVQGMCVGQSKEFVLADGGESPVDFFY